MHIVQASHLRGKNEHKTNKNSHPGDTSLQSPDPNPYRTDGTRQAGGYKRTMRPSPDENAYSTHRNSELRDNNDTSSQKTLLLQKTAQTPYKTVWKYRLKLLRIKRCSYLRLLKSHSSTFSLTKPDLSLLASMSMSGTPIRLWVSTF